VPKTLLIVDDSRFTLEISSFVASSAGYSVLTALDGVEALEILGTNAVDLVIVDINMPGIDGYELTRKIRSDEVLADVPIIIITTESEARDKEKGFAAGANSYLVKPVEPDDMVAQIQLLIGA
jgi:two-component system chemotaxis response regulator CheY